MSYNTKTLTDALSTGDVRTMGEDAINQQMAQNSWCPSLTLKQRVIGFVVCTIVGALFGILSFIVVLSLTTSPARFAVPYSLCILCLLGGTFFLIGPWRQLKVMFHKTRIITTIVFLVSIAGTLISAFLIKSAWLVLACVIVQICAFVWYSLSYIPYARTAIIKFVKHGCRRR